VPDDSYPFNTYSGLLTPTHYKRIGSAIWLFLWCISSTTAEKEKDGVVWGIVKGNKPHKLSELADIFKVNEKTIRRWIDDLDHHGYIKVTRAPYGLIFTVKNSKRGFFKRVDKNVQSENSDRTKMATLDERMDKNVQSESERSDISVQSNKDIISTSSSTSKKDDVDKIADRFIELRSAEEGKPVYPSARDYKAIAQIVARGMPLSQTIELLEQCFKEYAERRDSPDEMIKAFSYCAKYIGDHFKALKARERAKQEAAVAVETPVPAALAKKSYSSKAKRNYRSSTRQHHEIVPEWMKNKPKEKPELPKSNDPEWEEIQKNMTPEECERYLNAYTAILNTDQSAEDFQREYKEKYKKAKLREKQEEQKRAEYLEKYLSEI
jgi:predicted ArsR family transcriptional regulator